MLIDILVQILAIVLFLFIYWKRLKEDYSATLIFNSGFLVTTFVIVGALVALRFIPDWWFWFGLLGALMGFALGIYRYGLAVYESLEALIIGLLPWLGIVFLSSFVASQIVATGIVTVIIALLIFIYLLLDAHYKSFSWYKSGRVGFSGLTILGTFFIVRAAVAFIFPNMLSFTGIFDAIMSGLISFTAFIAVFNLSKKVS